jgi:AAA ATPase domain
MATRQQQGDMAPRDEFLDQWRAVRDYAASDADLIVQPFPGLRSFWQTESDLFFGRERQIDDLLQGLKNRKVTFVLGGSGSGKSSLVRAGVMPRLITASVLPPAGAWYGVEFRPGEAPSSQLFEAIIKQIIEPVLQIDSDSGESKVLHRYAALRESLGVDLAGCDPNAARRACRDSLRQLLFRGNVINVEGLIELANEQLAQLDNLLSYGARSAPPNLLILVDQFEEVFESKVRADDRAMLISLVKQVWKRNPDRLYLMVTMRSEELHRCSEFEGLADVINASLYLVDLIGESELVEAMEGPARRVLKAWGLDYAHPFTQNAVATLQQTYRDIADTSSSSDRLPLVQHLLTLVWHRAIQRWAEGPASSPLRIDVSDIQATEGWTDRDGPLRGCLTVNADHTLKEAVAAANRASGTSVETAKSLLRAAFCTLARRDDRGNPKRSFATLDDVLRASGVADRERISTHDTRNSLATLAIGLELFRRANLISVISEEGQNKYNVSHEAFIRGWRQYGEWMANARRCEDRLINVDEKLRDSANTSSSARGFGLMEFVLADRLRRADMIVSEDTARQLQDVLGPASTFSWAWARDVLARHDANQMHLMGTVNA